MNTFALPASAPEDYQFKGKTVSIPVKYIITAAYFYMAIPIAIFFTTWLRWYFGIPATLILGWGLWHLLKGIYQDHKECLILPVAEILLIGILTALWLYSTTIFFYQTWDQHFRNAVLRDLCEYSWPVIYERTWSALSYYLVQWMIPALVGKLYGFTMANLALWIWNTLGVFLVFLCICVFIKPKKIGSLWIVFLILVFWGGLNEIGYAWVDILHKGGCYGLSNGFGWPDMYHGYGYQFTPNDALLAWVYNQTIVPWLAITLFMLRPQIKDYAYLGLCAFAYGPIPFIGIFIYMVTDFAVKLPKGKVASLIKEAFSVQNICAVVSIYFVFALYYQTNVAAGHTGFYHVTDAFDLKHFAFLVVFYLLEFGIYALLIRKDYSGSPLLVVSIISLIIIPHIQLGFGRDFCMRASIPALFVLMILVIRYCVLHGENKINISLVVLIICLTVSGIGTAKDWANKIRSVRANNWSAVVADDVHTLADKRYENFVVPDYENTIFFKYLAKSHKIPNSVSENLSEIKSITDIDAYFDYLANKNCTIYIAVQDIQGYSLRQETVDRIKALGFDKNLDTLMQREYHSFIGIANNGELVVEQIGDDEHIAHSDKVDGYPVMMESATLNTGNLSVINIAGVDYSVKRRGLNIVVRDNAAERIIDCVNFDTHVDEMTCYR